MHAGKMFLEFEFACRMEQHQIAAVFAGALSHLSQYESQYQYCLLLGQIYKFIKWSC